MIPEGGGVLLIDKAAGPTSHDCVGRVRRALRTRRVGHTGTLDPFATGLLVVCVGPATRLSQWLTHLDKRYEAVVELGRVTTTLDPEGDVVALTPGAGDLTESQLRDVLTRFEGEQLQVPPVHSAKKVAGVAAHRRARRGEQFELEPNTVTVHAISLLGWQAPYLRLSIDCSSGTYIRALARDIGEATGLGGMLTELRRLRVGNFDVADAISLERLDELALAGDAAPSSPDASHSSAASAPIRWISPADALGRGGMPLIDVSVDERAALLQGRAVVIAPADERASALAPGGRTEMVALVHQGELVALAEPRVDRFQPRRVFAGVSGAQS